MNNFADNEFEVERKFEVDRIALEMFPILFNEVINMYQAYYIDKEDGKPKRIRVEISSNGILKSVICEKKNVGEIKGVPIVKEIEKDMSFEYGVNFIKDNNLKFINKLRHKYDYHGFTMEIDKFKNLRGRFKNFIAAEVEFTSEESMTEFEKLPLPRYVSAELTGIKGYSNKFLINKVDDTPFPYEELMQVSKDFNMAGSTKSLKKK